MTCEGLKTGLEAEWLCSVLQTTKVETVSSFLNVGVNNSNSPELTNDLRTLGKISFTFVKILICINFINKPRVPTVHNRHVFQHIVKE